MIASFLQIENGKLMNLKLNITVKLSPVELEKLLTEVIENQMPAYKVKNVKYDTCELDYGGGTAFNGVVVELTPKTP